jgi:hypothetical protein
MKIAIWTKHPGDLLGEAIDFLTHGNAQHAGFIRANGLIHEAYLPKVRDRQILDAERSFLKTFDLMGVTPEQDAQFERIFDIMLAASIEYSIADLFRYELNIPMPDNLETICSRYVYHTINQVSRRLLPLVRCDEDQISPRDLYISPRLLA